MEYPSNSRMPKKDPKAEKPKMEKIVTGEVRTRPISLSKRFSNVFFNGDFTTAVSSATVDVVIPATKNMIVDGIGRLVERLIYGESTSRTRRPEQRGPRVSYNSMTSAAHPRSAMLPNQPPHRAPAGRTASRDIILANRADAENILERLADIIDSYEVASVSDLNDMLGQPSSYVDHQWGWSNVSNSDIRQIREGYLIELPPVESI